MARKEAEDLIFRAGLVILGTIAGVIAAGAVCVLALLVFLAAP